MTNEEAIHELECNVDYKTPQIAQACKLAVRALEQQPCEDCISREAVKDLLSTEWINYCMPMELDVNLSFVLSKIAEMPSVTPSDDYNRGYSDAMRDIGEEE